MSSSQSAQSRAPPSDHDGGDLYPVVQALKEALHKADSSIRHAVQKAMLAELETQQQSNNNNNTAAASSSAAAAAAAPPPFIVDGVVPVTEVIAQLQLHGAPLLTKFQSLLSQAATAAALSDEQADQCKVKGNEELAKGAADMAMLHYTRGLMTAKSDKIVAVLLNNRATVLFQQRRWKEALADSQEALRLVPDYWKALQRRGRCLEELSRGHSSQTAHNELAAKDVAAAEAQDVSLAASIDEIDEILMKKAAHQRGEGELCSLSVPPTHQLSPWVEVQRDSRRRSLAARTRLGPGTVLVESPLAIAPKPDGMFAACSHCFYRTSTLYPGAEFRREGKKSRGLFCSRRCAEEHWNLYGHYESQSVFYLLCSVDLLLAMRMARSTFASSDFLGVPPDAAQTAAAVHADEAAKHQAKIVVQSFMQLDESSIVSKEVHPRLLEVGGSEAILCALAMLAGVLKDAAEAERVRALLRRIMENALEVPCTDRVESAATAQLRAINKDQNSAAAQLAASHSVFVALALGKAFYPIASLFSHSCDPNCIVSFRGNPYSASAQLWVRLIRPVMEGEPLTIAFHGIDKTRHHSTRGRIRALRAQFGFPCTCTVCANVVDEVIRKEDEHYYHSASDYYQKGRRLTREGNYGEAINVLFQSYDMVMRYICPPPRPPQMMLPKTHDALAQAYLLSGNSEKCVEHLTEALRLNRELHGGDYPDLVRDYARLATVARDESLLQKALSLMSLYYAPSEYLEAEKLFLLGSLRSPTVLQ